MKTWKEIMMEGISDKDLKSGIKMVFDFFKKENNPNKPDDMIAKALKDKKIAKFAYELHVMNNKKKSLDDELKSIWTQYGEDDIDSVIGVIKD